jgi:hypothetical protein
MVVEAESEGEQHVDVLGFTIEKFWDRLGCWHEPSTSIEADRRMGRGRRHIEMLCSPQSSPGLDLRHEGRRDTETTVGPVDEEGLELVEPRSDRAPKGSDPDELGPNERSQRDPRLGNELSPRVLELLPPGLAPRRAVPLLRPGPDHRATLLEDVVTVLGHVDLSGQSKLANFERPDLDHRPMMTSIR